MNLWIDAQLSPALAPWINDIFPGICATSLNRLGLRDAVDLEVFMAARKENTVILTKDADFVELLNQNGPPPKVIWLTCGNTSNSSLQKLLLAKLPIALEFLAHQESLVEIR
ncbi:MAG: DUF5615 family PIN-like protein [Akkermansiaceae bacterium]|nr:DUF5615 family PIN-like protein [Akkermansiaceae bacterium]